MTGTSWRRAEMPATRRIGRPLAQPRRGDTGTSRPGLDCDDIQVIVDEGAMTLKGEKRVESSREGGGCYRVERAFGAPPPPVPGQLATAQGSWVRRGCESLSLACADRDG
jgi:hypothetical protein